MTGWREVKAEIIGSLKTDECAARGKNYNLNKK